VAKQKVVKESNFVDSKQFDPKKHAIMVDRDLSHIFQYVSGVPPYVSTGTAAPVSTPNFIGYTYIDTVNHKVYVSDGTASSTDWRILN
jgi:hypothetical protein